MSWQTFDLTTVDHIATITFNQPDKRNAMTAPFWSEFRQAVDEVANDGASRVLIITSSGKHFTAGMDLSVFSSFEGLNGADPARANSAFMTLVTRLQQTFSSLKQARIPVIAAVQGGCIGAGLDLVCSCDLRVATRDAYFLLHEINIAMTADVGTFPRLTRLLPDAVAREMAYLGTPLTADRAERLGFVNQVFEDHDALNAGAVKMARQIATKSPLAIWGTKEVMNYAQGRTDEDTLKFLATWQGGMFSKSDVGKAVKAQMSGSEAQFDDLPRDRDLEGNA